MDQILQNLNQIRNLLKLQNNQRATNLIPKDIQISNIQTDEEKVKTFLLILSSVICLTTSIVVFLNFNLEKENNNFRLGLNNSLSSFEIDSVGTEQVKARIKTLERYNSLNSNKAIYSNFIKFTERLFSAIGVREILSYQINKDGDQYNFKVVFNSQTQTTFEDLKTKLETDKLLKEFKQTNIKYYQTINRYEVEVTGKYESK